MSPPRQPILPRVRFRVLARSGFCCVYCGAQSPFVELVVDHVLPVALDGSNDESNLAASCKPCNQGKAASNIVAVRATFLGWLRVQRGREDWVGDLADDEQRTPISIEPTSYKNLACVLRGRKARREELHAAWHAWREWKRGGRMTRATREIHKENRKGIRENAMSGACLWLKRGFWANGKFFPYSA
jgi:hypothetical protein